MKKFILRFVFHVIGIVTLVSLVFIFNIKADPKDIMTILSSIQNLTSAVFALSAIWIAISYPEAIKVYVGIAENVSLLKGALRTKRIELLVLTIFTTAWALIVTIIIQWCYAFLSGTLLLVKHKDILDSLLIGTAVYVSLVVIKALLNVMYINFVMADELHDKKDEAEAYSDLSK